MDWTLLSFEGFHIYFHQKLFFAIWNIFENFNQRQYWFIHTVHLVNFGRSLSKSHIGRSMLKFSMFVANSDQAKQMFETYWSKFETYCPFKDST